MPQLSKHFKTEELACKHCGECKLDSRLVPALEELREYAGVPIVVHDAYRCPVHNAAVEGAGKSQHLDGKAADIRLLGLPLKRMYELAEKVPAFKDGGIGLYDGGFIHVDVRGKRARWARVKGKYVGIEELL